MEKTSVNRGLVDVLSSAITEEKDVKWALVNSCFGNSTTKDFSLEQRSSPPLKMEPKSGKCPYDVIVIPYSKRPDVISIALTMNNGILYGARANPEPLEGRGKRDKLFGHPCMSVFSLGCDNDVVLKKTDDAPEVKYTDDLEDSSFFITKGKETKRIYFMQVDKVKWHSIDSGVTLNITHYTIACTVHWEIRDGKRSAVEKTTKWQKLGDTKPSMEPFLLAALMLDAKYGTIWHSSMQVRTLDLSWKKHKLRRLEGDISKMSKAEAMALEDVFSSGGEEPLSVSVGMDFRILFGKNSTLSISIGGSKLLWEMDFDRPIEELLTRAFYLVATDPAAMLAWYMSSHNPLILMKRIGDKVKYSDPRAHRLETKDETMFLIPIKSAFGGQFVRINTPTIGFLSYMATLSSVNQRKYLRLVKCFLNALFVEAALYTSHVTGENFNLRLLEDMQLMSRVASAFSMVEVPVLGQDLCHPDVVRQSDIKDIDVTAPAPKPWRKQQPITPIKVVPDTPKVARTRAAAFHYVKSGMRGYTPYSIVETIKGFQEQYSKKTIHVVTSSRSFDRVDYVCDMLLYGLDYMVWSMLWTQKRLEMEPGSFTERTHLYGGYFRAVLRPLHLRKCYTKNKEGKSLPYRTQLPLQKDLAMQLKGAEFSLLSEADKQLALLDMHEDWEHPFADTFKPPGVPFWTIGEQPVIPRPSDLRVLCDPVRSIKR